MEKKYQEMSLLKWSQMKLQRWCLKKVVLISMEVSMTSSWELSSMVKEWFH